MATRDRADLVGDACRSVLDQEVSADIELLVVDDASTDDTPSVLAALAAADSRVTTMRRNVSGGPSAARNRALEGVQGDFVAVLDDDDRCAADRFERQLAAFADDPDLGLVCSPARWVDPSGVVLGEWPDIARRGDFPTDPAAVFRLLYLDGNKIVNSSVMVRRDALGDLRYPDEFTVGEDWHLYLRMAARGVRMTAIADPLVSVRRGDRPPETAAAGHLAFVQQRDVLDSIRRWLADVGIHEFDRLHRTARQNQRLREVGMTRGLRGLARAHVLVLTGPTNRFGWHTLHRLYGRAARKALGRAR